MMDRYSKGKMWAVAPESRAGHVKFAENVV